jgi:hypothetical protein
MLKILRGLDMKDKIGLVFSHLHVRDNEMYKFDILNEVVDTFRNYKKDFFIVVSSHGCRVPNCILDKVDDMYWEASIDGNEIGRGHPKFCVKGYELLIQNGISKSLKLRGCDLIGNESYLYDLLETQDLIITEQTCLQKRMIGDLLMMGNTQTMLDLWSINPWNYDKSGLYNLFDNAECLAQKQGIEVEQYLKQNAFYLKPEEIQWYDTEKNWDRKNNCFKSEFDSSHLWGFGQYPYYGGF